MFFSKLFYILRQNAVRYIMLENQLLACVITCAVKITWMWMVYLALGSVDLQGFKFEDPLYLFSLSSYTTEEIQE